MVQKRKKKGTYKYFIKDTLNYILHDFLLFDDQHEAIWARNRLYKAVIIFKSELEKEIFEEYILRNQELFNCEISKENERRDAEIDTERRRERQHIIKRIQTGTALKRLLEKFREESN